MKTALKIVMLCLLAATACAYEPDTNPYEEFQTWKCESPNHRYFAAARRFPDESMIWKSDLDGFRLIVTPLVNGAVDLPDEKPRYSHDFAGRVPARIAWTPDSKFVVFTTVSSGGHRPYAFTAFVFSVDRHDLRCVDTDIGIVVSPDFDIAPPHTVQFQSCKQTDGIDFEHPFPVKVDLDRLFKHSQISST